MSLFVNETFLAIINPAAGGGRCGERVGAALDRLRAAGIALETAETSAAGTLLGLRARLMGAAIGSFLRWVGMGLPMRSSTGFFRRARSLRYRLSSVAR